MKIFLLILSTFFAVQTLAATVLPVPRMGSYSSVDETTLLRDSEAYRIGDEWGKIEATDDVISENDSFERAAMATTRTGGATGFVLGEFDGHVLIGTNHHVCPSRGSCSGSWTRTRIPFFDVSAPTEQFVGSWSEIDFALYTLDLSAREKAEVLTVAKNFDFDSEIYRGQKLVTSGFGVADNSGRRMMINFDSDCRVLSGSDEFRLMSDPDERNPADYQAWSFANGCDVSHGDSGSAMVDVETSSPIGIIWTGKIPKNAVAQSSANIADWEDNKSEEVWTEVSYAVPAAKIKEFLTEQLEGGEIDPDHERMVREFLGL